MQIPSHQQTMLFSIIAVEVEKHLYSIGSLLTNLRTIAIVPITSLLSPVQQSIHVHLPNGDLWK